MIGTIALKEFREAWRDGRFRIAAVVVLALLIVGLLLAWKQAERAREERHAASHMERDNWLEQGEKNAHSAGHFGVYAFKPTAALSLFDRGIEPYVGTTVFLEAHRQNPAAFLPAQDATAMRRFGDLTASAGLQLLAPLLIILLTFGAVAGERERRTLRQLLSLGVRPRHLLLGKALGLGAALALLFIPVAVLAVVVLSKAAEGEGGATGDVWQRALWLALAYTLYLAGILAISLAVSALAPSARSALAILLVFWAFNAVLAPRLAADLSERFLPTPELAKFEAELAEDLEKGLDGHDGRSKRMRDFLAKTLAEHGVQRQQDLPFNFRGLAMLESERMAGEVYDHHYGELWDRLEAQDRFVAWSGLFAPLLGLRTASMSLAGTDFAHHRHFSVDAEAYRRDFVRVLNEDTMKKRGGGHHGSSAGRELWEQLPAFTYEPPPVSYAWGASYPGLLVLALHAVGGWIILCLAARRLKPE